MTILLETVIAGSKLIATGQFTGTSSNQILWQDPDGSYFLTLLSDTGNYQILQVALPAGYTVVGVDNGGIPNAITNTVLDPGQSELMLEDTAGDLAYGSFYSSPTGSGFAASPIGRIAPGWTVAATANYNTANYFGDGQNLLETVQNNVGTLVPFGSNLAAFTIPNGFTVVPNGAGNYLGSDLPQTLLYNAAGTVEALLEGGTVVTQGQPQAVAVAKTRGPGFPDDILVANHSSNTLSVFRRHDNLNDANLTITHMRDSLSNRRPDVLTAFDRPNPNRAGPRTAPERRCNHLAPVWRPTSDRQNRAPSVCSVLGRSYAATLPPW